MKHILNLIPVLVVIALMSFGSSANAQKVAYIDADDIITQMPAYNRAKSEKEAYSKQLEKTLKAKEKEMQAFYQSAMDKVERGELTPQQQEEVKQELQEKQEKIQKEAGNADKMLMEKELELTKPLYEVLEAALKKVAKENEYSCILDKKFILYGAIDATAQVKTALGINR